MVKQAKTDKSHIRTLEYLARWFGENDAMQAKQQHRARLNQALDVWPVETNFIKIRATGMDFTLVVNLKFTIQQGTCPGTCLTLQVALPR